MRRSLAATCHTLTPIQSLIVRRWRPQWICRARQALAWLVNARSLATATPAIDDKPYYVTTPIFYVNAAPHVGHMYNMVLSDVFKRWQELKGRKAILCTGTDEHGIKMQQAATAKGLEPQALCDQNSEIFQDLAKSTGISNDIFIRTTDQKHKDAVEHAWRILRDHGYIYESSHEGWYCVSDETFYPKSQVQLIIEPETGRKIMSSIETGKEVQWTSERNYHFRMSAFKDRLLSWFEKNPDWIVPRSRMEAVIEEVKELGDLSISRPISRLTWGVRVPEDASQTVYVWLDALLNYATAIGYPFEPGQTTAAGWPPNLQVIGKDIIRFHCIYWPTLLMALDMRLPKQILTHAHWTISNQKMSKSTGKGVNPFFVMDRFGVDPVRFYLMHDGGIDDDANWDNPLLVKVYKKALQGGIGNLNARIRSRIFDVAKAVRAFAGNENNKQKVLSGKLDNNYRALLGVLRTAPGEVERSMEELYVNKAVRATMSMVYAANAHISREEPWHHAGILKHIAADTTGSRLYDYEKENQPVEQLEHNIDLTIFLCAEALRMTGIVLQAIIPDSAKKLLDSLGVSEARRGFEWCQVASDAEYGSSIEAKPSHLFPQLTDGSDPS